MVNIRLYLYSVVAGICLLTVYVGLPASFYIHQQITPANISSVTHHYATSNSSVTHHYATSNSSVTHHYATSNSTTTATLTTRAVSELDKTLITSRTNQPTFTPATSSLSEKVIHHLTSIPTNSSECAVKQSYLSAPNFHFTLVPTNSECELNVSAANASRLLFTFVHSTFSNDEIRKVIRSTWGRMKSFQGFRVVLRFIVGMPPAAADGANDPLQRRIVEEHRRYDDIIQGNFLDSYANISLKHASGLTYQRHRCPHAEWVVKADDDVFINFLTVTEHIMSAPDEDIFCPWLGNNEGVIRGGKWAISRGVYPYDRYPPFCHGQLLVYRQWLARDIQEATLNIPCHMWLDDVYFTGVLTEYVGGKHWRGLTSRWGRPPTHVHHYIYQLLHGQALPVFNETMRKLWEQLTPHLMADTRAVIL